MPVNANRPHLWKSDVAQSVDLYNSWFMQFAPQTYRETRLRTAERVAQVIALTDNLRTITPVLLRSHPAALVTLRMITAPPLARDRLIGLASTRPNLVQVMEESARLPPRMPSSLVDVELEKICGVLVTLIDHDLFPWLSSELQPTQDAVERAATIIADRLCGAQSDPLIRNEQERRQLAGIRDFLEQRGYRELPPGSGATFDTMPTGTFAFRLNVPILLTTGSAHINIPVDVVVMPHDARLGSLPLLIEAKSAGDFANTNKRRKEEAIKVAQLRHTYGEGIRYVLFLCGYFDSGYLGYEAAEGIDWVWEHRVDDFSLLGV
jgi:hypothetical protein